MTMTFDQYWNSCELSKESYPTGVLASAVKEIAFRFWMAAKEDAAKTASEHFSHTTQAYAEHTPYTIGREISDKILEES